MLTIRLSRRGKKKQIAYRLIISEKARDPYGRSLEILGTYNPTTKVLDAKADRINHWISKGAQLSPTVNNLLIKEEIIKGKKVKATKITDKKRKKAEEAKKEAKDKKPAEDAKPAEAVAEPASAKATAGEEKEEAPAETKEEVKEEPKKEEEKSASTEATAGEAEEAKEEK